MTSLIKIPVDKIYEDNNATTGISTHEYTIAENFDLLFDEETKDTITGYSELGKPFHYYSEFCQFIVQIIFETDLGFTIRLMDFKKDATIAMREYLKMKESEWPSDDLNKIMEVHLTISERSEMTLGVLEETQDRLLSPLS